MRFEREANKFDVIYQIQYATRGFFLFLPLLALIAFILLSGIGHLSLGVIILTIGLASFCFVMGFAAMNHTTLKRTYGDKNGKTIWGYEISDKSITLTINSKMANLTFEKQGLKSSRIYEHGVYIRHKRASFVVPLTSDKKKILAALQKYGWL